MHAIWPVYAAGLLVSCIVPLGTAIEDVKGDDVVPSQFPLFFRSRFNPRVLQTNERLISLSDITGVAAHVNSSHISTDATLSYDRSKSLPETKQSGSEASTNAGDDVEQQSKHINKTETEEVAGLITDALECGVMGPNATRFPWIAVLEHGGPQPDASRKRTLSKGVLIDRQHVLTTVSSVHNSHPSWVVTGVRLGDIPTRNYTNISRPVGSNKRDLNTAHFPIETVFLHESKDIALIRLANGGLRHISDSIRPICLPQEDYRLESFQLMSHVCQKYQTTSTRHIGRISRSWLEPMKVMNVDDCKGILKPYGARLPVKSFCVRENTTDNCTGSIGGPAIANIRGRYHVLGLRSYLHTETDVNGLDFPTVYVRVGGLRKWISAVIKAIGE